MAAEEARTLVDELAADQNPRRAQSCTWEIALLEIPDEAEHFRKAIHDERFSVASIARALERRNVNVARNALERHRNNRCTLCR